MRNIDKINIYTATELSEKLKINPSTLRKYAGIIDKENGEYFFQRDNTKARVYTEDSVDLIKRLIEIKDMPDMTLEKAARLALLEVKSEAKQASVVQPDISTVTYDSNEIAELKDAMLKQAIFLERLVAQNEQLIQEIQSMQKSNQEQQKQLFIEHQEEIQAKEDSYQKNQQDLISKLKNMEKKLEELAASTKTHPEPEKQSFFAKFFKKRK